MKCPFLNSTLLEVIFFFLNFQSICHNLTRRINLIFSASTEQMLVVAIATPKAAPDWVAVGRQAFWWLSNVGVLASYTKIAGNRTSSPTAWNDNTTVLFWMNKSCFSGAFCFVFIDDPWGMKLLRTRTKQGTNISHARERSYGDEKRQKELINSQLCVYLQNQEY